MATSTQKRKFFLLLSGYFLASLGRLEFFFSEVALK